jgi:hypothetical protein
MVDFNNFQEIIIEEKLPQVNHSSIGLWKEEGMIEFFGSGDRLMLLQDSIEVVKYSSEEIPVTINSQDFVMAGRNVHNYPSSNLSQALTHFMLGNV